jgi:hypothetical protein
MGAVSEVVYFGEFCEILTCTLNKSFSGEASQRHGGCGENHRNLDSIGGAREDRPGALDLESDCSVSSGSGSFMTAFNHCDNPPELEEAVRESVQRERTERKSCRG